MSRMFKGLEYPWDALAAIQDWESNPGDSGDSWQSQLVVRSGTPVSMLVSEAGLPARRLSEEFSVIDLPGPAIKGDASRTLSIKVGEQQTHTVPYYVNGGEPDRLARLARFEAAFDEVLDTMLYLVRECLRADRFQRTNVYWRDILSLLSHSQESDPAKYSLIVDLARPRELVEPIHRISDRPRKILRRIHEQERIQKVREIDTKCLTDLAQRPGSTIAEKAGPKQRLMAIQRTEIIDTLENRVTQHCIELSTKSARRYLQDHRDVDPSTSSRVRRVTKLHQRNRQALAKETFQGISRLLEPCRQPNYALLQNSDYSRVWSAYVQLIHNSDLRSNLWVWSRRLWASYMAFYLAAAIESIVEKAGTDRMEALGEKTVLASREYQDGDWLMPDSLPGPFIVKGNSGKPSTLYLTEGNHKTLARLSDRTGELAILNADYLLIKSRAGRLEVVPVYALFPPHHLERSRYVECVLQATEKLSSRLSSFAQNLSHSNVVGGWVLVCNWDRSGGLQVTGDVDPARNIWLSSVSSDYRKWFMNDLHEPVPLLSLCEGSQHADRN